MASKSTDMLCLEGLKLDHKACTMVSGARIHILTPIETKLLGILMACAPRATSREALVRQAWETDYTQDSRMLGRHITSLRKKLATNRVWVIETVWGLGYRLVRRRT